MPNSSLLHISIFHFCLRRSLLQVSDAGRRTKFAPVKSLDSSEFSSEFSDLKTLWSNVKVNPVISWNGQNSFHTVGTIDIGTNPSEPTSECGLGNLENPSEPTTPLPSPQYGKAEASEIGNTFCWLKFSDFSSGTTRYDWLDFSDFSSRATRYDSLKFSDFHQGPIDTENQKS